MQSKKDANTRAVPWSSHALCVLTEIGSTRTQEYSYLFSKRNAFAVADEAHVPTDFQTELR